MALQWNYILEYTLHSCIIVIHIVALIFLRRSRYSNRYKNQMIIITSLCSCELAGAVLFISYRIFECYVSLLVANIILCFALVFAVSVYYFIMVLLTIDRFLVFFLKFRYQSYFSPLKILKLILALTLVCLLTAIIFAVLTSMQIIAWSQLENKMFLVYLVFDVAYILLVIGTYSFIFRVYRKQRKFRKTTQGIKKENSFKLLVPTLIIVTFIIHNFIPNIINIIYRYKFKTFNETFIKFVFICYRIGWLLTPLIYIFFASSSQNAYEKKGELRSIVLKIINSRKK